MRKIVVALVWLGLSIVPQVSAQSGNGTLRGKVVDEQGAPMPGVTVTASRSVGTAIVEPPAELRMLGDVSAFPTNSPTSKSRLPRATARLTA